MMQATRIPGKIFLAVSICPRQGSGKQPNFKVYVKIQEEKIRQITHSHFMLNGYITPNRPMCSKVDLEHSHSLGGR